MVARISPNKSIPTQVPQAFLAFCTMLQHSYQRSLLLLLISSISHATPDLEKSAATEAPQAAHYAKESTDNRPSEILVDLLEYPHLTTIPDRQPELSWVFNNQQPGEGQSAYEIIVSSSADLAAAEKGDIWSSGRVESTNSVHIEIGTELTPGQTYFVCVRTWSDQTDLPSEWSQAKSFTIEPTAPVEGAKTVYKSSENRWSGSYQPDFNSIVAPVRVIEKSAGHYFIDFGRAGFGYCSLDLKGDYAGQKMEIRLGEAADGDCVHTKPGATIRYRAGTVDLENGAKTYDLRLETVSRKLSMSFASPEGKASGEIMPFRYVEVIGCPEAITPETIRQYVLHTPFNEGRGVFNSSNDTLNAVWDLCRYSMKATTFAGLYVDGDRERKPYEADAYINQLSHYAVEKEYTTNRHTFEYMLENPTWPTEWRFHFPLIAWAEYMATGDDDALYANYDDMVAQLLLNQVNENGMFVGLTSGSHRTEIVDIVDWPTGERDGYELTPMNTVVNAFHYNALRLMAEIATVVGESQDAQNFTKRADTIEAQFDDLFFNGTTYQDGETSEHISAHANFFPLAFGLVEDSKQQTVVDFLKTKRMAPSVYAAQYLLEALFMAGEEDYAIGLMADNDPNYKRHWWNMIVEGSTITMEAWDNEFKKNTDWNHAWGAAPGNIISRFVMGVKPLTPGYAKTEIKPQLGTGDGDNGLTKVTGTVPTIRGDIAMHISNSPTDFKIAVVIPGNMHADISIPNKGHDSTTLFHNGVEVTAEREGQRLVLKNLPSGSHSICLTTP